MSVIEPRSIELRDGASVTLRCLIVDEAPAILNYLDVVRRETDGIMFDPLDTLMTLEEERAWLRNIREQPGSLQIAAEAGGQIVGLAGAHQGKRVREQHVATLGISLRRAWQGRGLGTAMMRELIAWCREHEAIELMALTVFPDNALALAVYRKLGFCDDGVLPCRAKRNGRYVDLVAMSLWVGAGENPRNPP